VSSTATRTERGAMAKEVERLKNALLRRPGRTYDEEHVDMEPGRTTQREEGSRNPSPHSEKDIEMSNKESRSGSVSIDTGLLTMPVVNLGKELSDLFPRTAEDMGKHGKSFVGNDDQITANMCAVIKSLEAANTVSTNEKFLDRPLNFGVVLPGSVYRSSFPQEEDFSFLQGLGLKTIV
jgi:tyrosine-protein phosphatase SIW14